ncbi:MAG: DUF2309 domain-containing protein [Bacteroidia bacterium]
MVKWLSAFLDEGLAEWEMPFKKEGFYSAWRRLAPYDQALGKVKRSEIPASSEEALTQILADFSEEQQLEILTQQLAALPGWAGYIHFRNEQQTGWQQQYPLDLKDYLAVRLWTSRRLKTPIFPQKQPRKKDQSLSGLQYLWLKAWERSWQKELVQTLESASEEQTSDVSPEAQLVFCIDTRSELIRRHVEAQGAYETFGYAGFFGIAMDYQPLEDGHAHKACPPILPSSYRVSEVASANQEEAKQAIDRRNGLRRFWNYFLKRMKNMLPSSFGFVEGSGFFYGLNLLRRTLTPTFQPQIVNKNKPDCESVCEPHLHHIHSENAPHQGIPIGEKVSIVKAAFELTGWKSFAPLVVFAGHGSQSANNPFGSSLDCGACAASPGRHNARMLARLANEVEVRNMLSASFGIHIPETTLFVAAEHNTTTDEIVLFDAGAPASHQRQLAALKADLQKAQETATQERLGVDDKSVLLARKNASNWGETRPEWGLAKNASFIIAPRAATQHCALDGRCFLHSYDWKADRDGAALEAIMQGPMVVTQWINNHYYFSTVDNEKFGGGTKTTHNITGKFGVVQGNGSDLKMGLPRESLFASDDELYHLPLRLSVVIQAPFERVQRIIAANQHLRTLVENEWLYLIVMDPIAKTTIYVNQDEHKPALAENQRNAVPEPMLVM